MVWVWNFIPWIMCKSKNSFGLGFPVAEALEVKASVKKLSYKKARWLRLSKPPLFHTLLLSIESPVPHGSHYRMGS